VIEPRTATQWRLAGPEGPLLCSRGVRALGHPAARAATHLRAPDSPLGN
jgi:hypothetical protein